MGRAWLRALADSADVELAGLVDLDVETARRAAAECGHPDVPVAVTLDGLAEVACRRRAQRDRAGGPPPGQHRGLAARAARCCARSRWPRRWRDGLAMVAAARGRRASC